MDLKDFNFPGKFTNYPRHKKNTPTRTVFFLPEDLWDDDVILLTLRTTLCAEKFANLLNQFAEQLTKDEKEITRLRDINSKQEKLHAMKLRNIEKLVSSASDPLFKLKKVFQKRAEFVQGRLMMDGEKVADISDLTFKSEGTVTGRIKYTMKNKNTSHENIINLMKGLYKRGFLSAEQREDAIRIIQQIYGIGHASKPEVQQFADAAQHLPFMTNGFYAYLLHAKGAWTSDDFFTFILDSARQNDHLIAHQINLARDSLKDQ